MRVEGSKSLVRSDSVRSDSAYAYLGWTSSPEVNAGGGAPELGGYVDDMLHRRDDSVYIQRVAEFERCVRVRTCGWVGGWVKFVSTWCMAFGEN